LYHFSDGWYISDYIWLEDIVRNIVT